jgi:hypothetical protein
MPWDELEARSAFEDHVDRQLTQAEGARRGAAESGAREPQPAGARG